MSGYIGVNNKARKIKNLYVGVNGIARKVKKAYIGDASGKARLWYSSGTALSGLAVGSILKLKENGRPAEFILAQHNYNSGRALVVRRGNLADRVNWGAQPNYLEDTTDRHWGPIGNYSSGCYLRSWLNGTYLARFDSATRTLIGTTSYRFNAPGNNTSVLSDNTAVFVLSAAEIYSFSGTGYIPNPGDGSLLPAAARNVLNAASGSWWTRSNSGQKNTVSGDDSGDTYYNGVLYWTGSSLEEGVGAMADNALAMVRPCFTLPETAVVDDTGLLKGEESA